MQILSVITIFFKEKRIVCSNNDERNNTMQNPYRYEDTTKTLYITGSEKRDFERNTSVAQFCKDYGIELSEFNIPIIIEPQVTGCVELLKDCKRFNQPVIFPEGIKYCEYMFEGCEEFNQSIQLPDSVRTVHSMFYGCKTFNQPVSIPNGVTKCDGMFMGCTSFNQPISIPQSVRTTTSMFRNCIHFNQSVILPENLVECMYMFEECIEFDQPVTVGKKVENCNEIFLNCKSLNHKIEFMTYFKYGYDDCLKNCDKLQPENVYIHMKKTTQRVANQRLCDLWGTEEPKLNTNIVWEKAQRRKIKITNLTYTYADQDKEEYNKEEIDQMTAEQMMETLKNHYRHNNLHSVEYEIYTSTQHMCLALYFDKEKVAISIFDDWKDIIYYYNSKTGSDELVDIHGNVYPEYMVTEDFDTLQSIVMEFISKGKRTNQVAWKKE